MKNFNDLQFDPHRTGDGLHGKAFFENGYGISVVRFKLGIFSSFRNGYGSYTENENQWEVAVLRGDNEEYTLCYDTPITDDVIGYQSEDDVAELMRRIQELPSIKQTA